MNSAVNSPQIAWLIPAPMEGSGGFRTILSNANFLQDMGYDCTLYVDNRHNGNHVESIYVIKRLIKNFFGGTRCRIKLGWEPKGEYDLMFATYWETARVVRDYPKAKHKAYFIQDFEAYFNPMGDGYIFAENSYKYGLAPVSIGKWLTKTMQESYGVASSYFDLCADANIYFDQYQEREELSVCAIYQPEKPRRCPVIAVEALGILKHLMPEVKIYLYGSNQVGNIWYDHTNLKIVSPEECAALYNKCSIGLCLSSSNPSRIPFEMMACGLPVVEMYKENNFYDLPDTAALLADSRPESLALAMQYLLENPRLRARMSAAATDHMKHKDISLGYSQFLSFVENLLSGEPQHFTKVSRIYNKRNFTGDIDSINSYPEKGGVSQIAPRSIKLIVKRLLPYHVRKAGKEVVHITLYVYRESRIIAAIVRRVTPFGLRKRAKSILVRFYG